VVVVAGRSDSWVLVAGIVGNGATDVSNDTPAPAATLSICCRCSQVVSVIGCSDGKDARAVSGKDDGVTV